MESLFRRAGNLGRQEQGQTQFVGVVVGRDIFPFCRLRMIGWQAPWRKTFGEDAQMLRFTGGKILGRRNRGRDCFYHRFLYFLISFQSHCELHLDPKLDSLHHLERSPQSANSTLGYSIGVIKSSLAIWVVITTVSMRRLSFAPFWRLSSLTLGACMQGLPALFLHFLCQKEAK
ncbi:hypothetical protein L873DRAFT_1813112 [Choiromyces venosus 120613-1]|uniref:Uncharacterized protein n=1 Tax=Choiromyces venosus 120613-1 TaxID=1336337 RepID=A0A3N4JA85_9PEZI|nr:hypothetical protein L873DRAFT_1813112 [Choiromyces venosus 120613-1]